MLFRPELLQQKGTPDMANVTIALADGLATKTKGVYVSGTDRLVAVTAETLSEFERQIGRKAGWVITHVGTGMGMARFADKARAIQVARELYGRLPLSFWQAHDAAELAPPDEVVAWLKARKEGER
jgi:hypothetical protein